MATQILAESNGGLHTHAFTTGSGILSAALQRVFINYAVLAEFPAQRNLFGFVFFELLQPASGFVALGICKCY